MLEEERKKGRRKIGSEGGVKASDKSLKREEQIKRALTECGPCGNRVANTYY